MTPSTTLTSITSTVVLILNNRKMSNMSSTVTVTVPLTMTKLILAVFIHALTIPIIRVVSTTTRRNSCHGVRLLRVKTVTVRNLQVTVPTTLLLFVPTSTIHSKLRTVPN